MSNVLYQCPICGNRLFAAPGGSKLTCRWHTETKFEQVEEYRGPNFAWKEEGDTDPAKTGIRSHGVNAKNINVVAGMTIPPMTDQQELVFLREMYERVTQESVDKRWSLGTLKNKIEEQEFALGKQLEEQEKSAEVEADENVPDESQELEHSG